MTDSRPLHVCVAEATGWTDIKSMDVSPFGKQWFGKPPKGYGGFFVGDIDHSGRVVTLTPNYGSIPKFDTSWEATGPLIERYGITVFAYLDRETPDLRWLAGTQRTGDFGIPLNAAHGPTPLVAVCDLILALKAAGKLSEVK